MGTYKICSNRRAALFRLTVLLAVVAAALSLADVSIAATKWRTFASPEEAVRALVAAGEDNDMKGLMAILGPGSREVLFSGDDVADRQGREMFRKAYDEKNGLSIKGDTAVLVIGNDDWPFPIPVVKKGGVWHFDTARGKEEILDRRIGRNELNTIQTLLAIVDAQREYAMEEPDHGGVPEYARKFFSAPGKKDGLYWPTREGEAPSPLGPLVAQAVEKGYKAKKPGGGPAPYQGYFYRMLAAQGRHATDGAYGYIVHGKMIGGFAVEAHPARYGNTGVMTFIVNQDGVVYQKDLGSNTEKLAQKMTEFDPDDTWQKIK